MLLFPVTTISYAQSIVSGTVTSADNNPIAAATIRLKGTGKGTVTDSTGSFAITAPVKGKYLLQVSSVGFKTSTRELLLNDSSININIILTSAAKTLGEVVVVGAGTFEASDKAKGASLTPIDAVTVAGNGGDIANALRSLPGAQQIGEKEGLFVRGGTGEESKQFVDGTLLKNPNYSSVPGLPQYARLNPFLFKGILFSSGGYSALYGEALSSALILETVDLPDKSSASAHFFPQSMGAGIQQLSRDRQSSYGMNFRYGNLHPYNQVVKQQPDFFHGPEYLTADINYRTRTSKTGMLKLYANYGYSHTGMLNTDIDSTDLHSLYEINGTNAYVNLSYRESLKNRWKIDAAIAFNYYKEALNNGLLNDASQKIYLSWYPYNQKNNTLHTKSDFAQARVVFSKGFSLGQTIRFGTEYFYTCDNYTYNDTTNVLTDNLQVFFIEDDIRITQKLAARIGIRAEYSDLLQQLSVAPRISLGYKLPDGSQLNIAYGVYYQKPENRYLLHNDLSFTKATHYILNYQKKMGNRLLRAETYYKTYKNLVTTVPVVANDGDGYARGIELFWRDKKTFKGFDYWISYTYLDTKRTFMDYPYALRPNFSTPHTLAIAIKKFFPDINLSANLAYTLATGRPYYNFQSDATGNAIINDQGTTNTYNGLNMSFAYMFSLFPNWKSKDFSGIGFGLNNLLGTKQVFDYRYSYNGKHKTPVMLAAPRSYYFGLFMTFGIDRRDDFINENL